MKKLLPPHLFVLTVLAMGLICYWFKLTHYITFPVNLFGIIPIVAGLTIAQMAKNRFKKEQTTVQTFDIPQKLITSGLFGVSRNPMYLGFFMGIIGFFVLYQGSVSSLIILVLFFIIVNGWYIPFEEKVMRNQFGDAYLAYCKTTRRWI